MSENQDLKFNYEPYFDVNNINFNNVSKDFESKFRERYKNSLEMMSEGEDELENASAASSIGILEKMAQQLSYYNRSSDFDSSYHELIDEYEPFRET